MPTLPRRLPSPILLRRRHYSSHTSPDLSALSSALKSRTLPLLYDYLTPQPSQLLTTTLSDFLPFLSSNLPTSLPSITTNPAPLPPAYHLVYFPPPTRPSSLLPDGTDTLHSPGPPYTNRLWAGGRIYFPPHSQPVLLDGTRAAIVEGIRNVRFSGTPATATTATTATTTTTTTADSRRVSTPEKVFISIERRLSAVSEGECESAIRARLWRANDSDLGHDNVLLLERRDLCFLLPPSAPSPNPTTAAAASPTTTSTSTSTTPQPSNPHRRTTLPPPPNPVFTHTLTPTPALLARYSALTYNAHAIHLDPLYTRTQYGLAGLVVHGPLLVTLMLTVLDHELQRPAAGLGPRAKAKKASRRRLIREINYKCLRPVFVGEEVRVCGKRSDSRRRRRGGGGGGEIMGCADADADADEEVWEVWVEKGGHAAASLAVKGSVRTEWVG